MGFGAAWAVAVACIKPPPPELPGAELATVAKTAALVLWPGRSPGRLYAPGEVRAFRLRQGGQDLGYSYGRYVGVVAEAEGVASGEGRPQPQDRPHQPFHRFETRIELELPGQAPVRSEGELILDDRGALVSGSERSDAAQLQFSRSGDVLRLEAGDRVDEIGYQPERADAAIMAFGAILHQELMFGLRELKEGTLELRLISLSGGVPVPWAGNCVKASAANAPGEFSVTTNLGERVWLRDGRIVSIEVEADGLEVVALPTGTWPSWTVHGPKRPVYRPSAVGFEIREVEVLGRPGQEALAGEILVPTKGAGPFPGAVFVSAMGQQDRYGFAGPPYVARGSHEITDALAAAGFVVLRYDERGFGKSPKLDVLRFETQVEEAKSAVATLLVQEQVDPERIVLIGHGEGGWRALQVAADRPRDVRGVALLASPGRSYQEVWLRQAERAAQKLPVEVRASARVEQRKLVDLVLRGMPPPELAEMGTWLREALAVDPEALVARTRCGLFLGQGGKDFEVDPELDVEAWVRAARRHDRALTVRRYPDLDHLFMHEPQTSSPARYREQGRSVDAGFLADLVAWAREVVRRPGRGAERARSGARKSP